MTPDNGAYAIAAYVLGAIVYVSYMAILRVREKALRRKLSGK